MTEVLSMCKSFELKGLWWISPDRKVPGTLKYNVKSIYLVTDEVLEDDQTSAKTICGEGQVGEVVFLLGCYSCRKPSNLPSKFFTSHRYLVNRILIGQSKLTGDCPNAFLTANICFPKLRATFDMSEVKASKVTHSNLSNEGQLFIKSEYDLKTFSLRLCKYLNLKEESSLCHQHGFFQIQPLNPQPLAWFSNMAGNLSILMTILYGQFCPAVEVSLNPVFDSNMQSPILNLIDDHKEWDDINSIDIDMARLILRAPDLDLNQLLNKYFAKPDALYPVLNIQRSTIESRGHYHQLDFVNLVQAIEGFNRIVNGGIYIQKNEFKNIRREVWKLMDQLASHEPDLLNNMKASINHSNELSQKTRLKQAIKIIPPIICNRLNLDDSFVDIVVKTRNSYVHIDDKPCQTTLSDWDITFWKMKLQILLLSQLLLYFGVSERTIEEAIPELLLFQQAEHGLG